RLEREHGPIGLRLVATAADLAGVRRALEELDARAGVARGGGGLRSFHWALMDAAAARGALDLAILTAGDTFVAFELNFKVDRRVTSLAIGYDEAFAPYGPGQLLRAGVLRRYCEDAAVDLYDFMPGGAGHKGDWATIVEPYAKIYVYRRGIR